MQAESKDYVTIILERLLIFHMTRKKNKNKNKNGKNCQGSYIFLIALAGIKIGQSISTLTLTKYSIDPINTE